MSKRSVCVYCGARFGKNPNHLSTAKELGKSLADHDWRLVYGAGDVGLMGAVASAAQNAGGETFGVIPKHLIDQEVGKTDLTHFIVTETMHERKKVMFMNADAVIVLPGGAGSLDELFEVLTWRQLGLHEKPIVLINSNAYWSPLIQLLQHVVDEGFADADILEFVTVVPDAQAAIHALGKTLNP
ncbi:MAG: TIGR00730 family Rossman fold protein [Paracoccaceae bacterium]